VKRAIVSDIHGNLEAAQAVLAEIRAEGIDEIFCLGDVIGYGPDPCECIELAMEFQVTVLGNHDQGALFDPEGFSSGAERAIFWTRRQLESSEGGIEAARRRINFLCDLPRYHRDGKFLFVHGSARNPLNEYVFPEDIYNARKMEKIFGLVEHYCFQGHTHVPGVFTEDGRFHSPQDLNHRYTLSDQKAMINVGSVGQPRDGDPRSSYVVLMDDRVEFRRLEYPVETTVRKVHETVDLDNFLGDRLREGR